MKHYIKKYKVVQTSDYLFTLTEHVQGGLYIVHNPMPWMDIYKSIMRATKGQDIIVSFVYTKDIQEECSHGGCNKPCSGFTIDNHFGHLSVGYPFCDVHALEHVGFINWRIRRVQDNPHAK